MKSPTWPALCLPSAQHRASLFLVSCHRCWLTRPGQLELNSAIDIFIFNFALPTLFSPPDWLTVSRSQSLAVVKELCRGRYAQMWYFYHSVWVLSVFFFSWWHEGSNVVSIIYYAHHHPYCCYVTAPAAAVCLPRSETNGRQGREPWSDFWNSSSEKTSILN